MRWYERPVIKHIEHIGILLAVCAVLFDTYWRFAVDRPIANEERIERAWETLSRRIPGESGKLGAIQVLKQEGIPLTGIDLSCNTMRGRWDTKEYTCRSRTWLQKADFSGSDDERSDLNYSNFSGANLVGANFSNANLWRSDFSGAWLQNAKFTNVNLKNASLESASIGGADFTGTKFVNLNISGTNFCDRTFKCVKGFDNKGFITTWFWADKPPIFSNGVNEFNLTGALFSVCPRAESASLDKPNFKRCELIDEAKLAKK